MKNFYQLAAMRFRALMPDKVFLHTAEEDLSYQDLDYKTAKVVELLQRLDLNPNDRVLYQGPKCIEAVVLYLGVLRSGLIFVPVNSAYTDVELDYFLADAEPALIICEPMRAESIAGLASRPANSRLLTLGTTGQGTFPKALAETPPQHFEYAPENADTMPAAIVYTSGTTGHPKGALLSHANLISNALALYKIWGWQSDDVLLHALPINHVHGLFVALHCALLGASMVLLHSKFDVDAVLADLPRATVFMGVPTYYTRLLANTALTRQATARMRLFVSGSAPLLADTFHAFEHRTGHRILERYGMTETGMIASNPLAGPRLPGTVGQPLPAVEIRLGAPNRETSVGVLEVRGENVFAGYWRKAEQTAQAFTSDGWFRTGDLARIEAGVVSIMGRVGDMIITGGLNVYPKEIESLLDADPCVAESAVFGVPHPDFGEAVVAACVPRPGKTLKTDQLLASLKTSIASFKKPKKILTVAQLPRNTMGKVQKNELRKNYQNLFSE